METKFQTSFIPRKSVTPTTSSSAEHRPASILLMIGVFAFVISVLAAGGSYGWQVYLQSDQQKYSQSLELLKKDFNIDLIVQLKQTATKIVLASQLLDKHVAISQVFGLISKLTASNIRFTSLDLQAPADRNKGININMSGYAPSYEALAFQSDKLGHLEDLDLRNIIISPTITNPAQNQNSTVSFQLSANINPTNMLYKNLFFQSSTINQ